MTSSIVPEQRDGWGYPLRANKQHYIRGRVSLCGRHVIGASDFIYTVPNDRRFDTHCRECWRRRLRL